MRESAIFDAHRTSVVDRIQQERVVLAIQRITELNCLVHSGLSELEGEANSGEPAPGLDSVSDSQLCTTLAVTGAGQPLGLLDQQILSHRANGLDGSGLDVGGLNVSELGAGGHEGDRLKWLMARSNRQLSLPRDSKVVAIADHSTELAEIFATPREPGLHLLLRVCAQTNGGFSWADRLSAEIAQVPVAGSFSVSIKDDRSHGHRQARLAVSYSKMMLPRLVDSGRSNAGKAAVPVTVLWAREPESFVGDGASPQRIDWCLVSDLPIHSFEQACLLIRWYSFRSLLRQYHSLLKSGLQIEQFAQAHTTGQVLAGQAVTGQAVTSQRLARQPATPVEPSPPGLSLAAHGLRAWELLRLLQGAQAQPQTSCEALLSAEEWQAMFCSIYQTSLPPRHAPSIRQALHWVVQLGGGMSQSPQEGSSQQLHCLWRGFRRLDALTQVVPQPV